MGALLYFEDFCASKNFWLVAIQGLSLLTHPHHSPVAKAFNIFLVMLLQFEDMLRSYKEEHMRKTSVL